MLTRTLVLFLLLLGAANSLPAQGYNRSIDTKEGQSRKVERKRQKLTREEKYVISIENKKAKEERRKKNYDYRMHKKAVKKHNRLINGKDKNIVTGKKVHKQMRKSKREAMRRNKSKNPLPWYKRIF
ncbi:MAG: hypothetical protein KA793_00400 [Bacteroidales bacterium]|nr:hypothetical protein [Bacteroidales bacterium]